MQSVKTKVEEYLNDKISLDDFNSYLRENVPFSPDTVIEDIRYDADITIKGELTEKDIEDELISEKTLKERLKVYLKEL